MAFAGWDFPFAWYGKPYLRSNLLHDRGQRSGLNAAADYSDGTFSSALLCEPLK